MCHCLEFIISIYNKLDLTSPSILAVKKDDKIIQAIYNKYIYISERICNGLTLKKYSMFR